jgi:hypothetical protein
VIRSVQIGNRLVGSTQPCFIVAEAAEVETPDARIDTPYCEQGEAPQSCFITITEWEMSDAPQESLWVPESEARRAILFMHPPAQATFTVTLPVTPAALVFWMGIDPAAHAWMGDGVVYHVQVSPLDEGLPAETGTMLVFTRALTAEQARQGWQPAQVDLSAWAGQEVRLTLETDPGPPYDGQGDWAGWGDARLGGAAEAAYALAEPARRAAAAWEQGGFTAQDLIAAGAEARQAERYEEALAWYERAVRARGEKLDTFPGFQQGQLLVLESFATANAWQPCSWCENTASYFGVQEGVVKMSYRNAIEERDSFAFLTTPEAAVGDFSEMLL